MKARIAILNVLILCASVVVAANTYAREKAVITRGPVQLELASGSAMVVELKNNKVLFASNPDVIVPIASITKLMT
ncbi:MAG: hypothetical protein ACREB5_09480, partial [Sphingomonadaceae bacterium]